eukprot:evm.model.scf_525.5 EVM.evm.TU.scf_525.5   scf_525:19303-21938(+)
MLRRGCGDRTLLETSMQTREGKLLTVQISLPHRFPDEPPVLTVNQPTRHPAIDNNGRIKLQALQYWHPGHRLAVVVQDAQSALFGQAGPAGSTGRFPPVNSKPGTPHINAALQNLSDEDLWLCIIDAAKYQQFANRVLQSSQAPCVNEDLRKSNIDVAQSNLERENEIREIGNHIAIIKSSEYADARGLYEEHVQRQQEIVGHLSIRVLREQLQHSAKKVGLGSGVASCAIVQ